MIKSIPIEPLLQQYIDQSILPQYAYFDLAHQIDHAHSVIYNSLLLAQYYPVNINMVYTIAAYHDIGLIENRRTHHLASGHIIRQDTQLSQWFNEKQIETMAQAVEDHRASAKQEPRSIYGKIVAEADRQIDSESIVLRTIQYGLSHYPELNKEKQWLRTLSHLKEKYGDTGYIRLWLPESPNAEKLQQLRKLIKNEFQLKALFEKIYSKQ